MGIYETTLEIDLRALTHNFQFLKSKLQPKTKFMAVVKAFGYGSDAIEIAKHLESLEVDYFAVAYTSEGMALRDAGIETPIMVLHPLPIHFDEIIERCLEPSLYNAKTLKGFIEVAKKHAQKDYPIHIKFNTGLNRLGFWENDVEYIIEKLKATSSVKVLSILSHLAASEDLTERSFTQHQIGTFKKIASEFERKVGYEVKMHQCNTSGILNYPEAHFDMVRSGIGLYGFGNDPKFDDHLRPIASLKSVISQIHTIEPGETVGYNRAYKAPYFQRTATIPVGHADGISRIYGNEKGWVMIKGKKAPIIGNVCMDMIMVNITDIDCKEGDEVVIFGKGSSANALAENAGTISYELITSVSQRVKRTVLR
ncbi:alanine racemase [Sungkyunkwania multivorans]|uniref:Alanine racemase n=1 Tax=Sungkyunkwania multivorans TaxID=1173618 RepID=A0ABW3D0U5_9FLAO